MATTPPPLTPAEIRAIDRKYLDPDGPSHPDPETEIRILRMALGYGPTERDPWTSWTAPPTSRPEPKCIMCGTPGRAHMLACKGCQDPTITSGCSPETAAPMCGVSQDAQMDHVQARAERMIGMTGETPIVE